MALKLDIDSVDYRLTMRRESSFSSSAMSSSHTQSSLFSSSSTDDECSSPVILDVEASGFGRGSYPIEVGLSLSDNTIESRLIRPLDGWTHWDTKAEALHGISREQIEHEGIPAQEVAQWLNSRLKDAGTVYSDSWGYDSSWIGRLFNDVGVLQRFRLESLRRILSEKQLHRWDAARERIETSLHIRRHRAGEDVKLLKTTYLETLR